MWVRRGQVQVLLAEADNFLWHSICLPRWESLNGLNLRGGGVQTSRVALELNYANVLRETTTTTTKTNNEGKSLGGTSVICNMNQNPDLISVVS